MTRRIRASSLRRTRARSRSRTSRTARSHPDRDRRAALLQPRAGPAARRGGGGRRPRRLGGRTCGGHRRGLGQDGDSRRRFARVHRQSRQPAVHAGAVAAAPCGDGLGRIDRSARLTAAGFPMGPFALMDLIGIDVNLAAARGLFEASGRPPRFRPSPIQEDLVAAGRLGRKTGEGFYRYEAGRATGPAGRFAGEIALGPSAPKPLDAESIAERVILAIVNEAYPCARRSRCHGGRHRPRDAARRQPPVRTVRMGSPHGRPGGRADARRPGRRGRRHVPPSLPLLREARSAT